MRTCLGCKYAEWHTTANGRLHPSGDGECKYPWKMPALPASRYWMAGPFAPFGGHINRRKELKEDCVYYTRADHA